MRVWLALSLLTTHWAPLPDGLETVLPLRTMAALPVPALVVGSLLLLGLATRLLTVTLLAALSTQMLDPLIVDRIYLTALLLMITMWRSGRISADALIERTFRSRFPQWWGEAQGSAGNAPRIVIVGAGFGGIACARTS